jgi:hypothetical protein
MNEKVRKHVKEYCEKKGWGTTDRDIIETITNGTQKAREEIDRHRWWVEYFYTVEIEGMNIGYCDCETDDGVDRGYEFDVNSICEVIPVQKTIIIYKPAEEPDGESESKTTAVDLYEKMGPAIVEFKNSLERYLKKDVEYIGLKEKSEKFKLPDIKDREDLGPANSMDGEMQKFIKEIAAEKKKVHGPLKALVDLVGAPFLALSRKAKTDSEDLVDLIGKRTIEIETAEEKERERIAAEQRKKDREAQIAAELETKRLQSEIKAKADELKKTESDKEKARLLAEIEVASEEVRSAEATATDFVDSTAPEAPPPMEKKVVTDTGSVTQKIVWIVDEGHVFSLVAYRNLLNFILKKERYALISLNYKAMNKIIEAHDLSPGNVNEYIPGIKLKRDLCRRRGTSRR